MTLLTRMKQLYQRGKWTMNKIYKVVSSYMRGTTLEEDIQKELDSLKPKFGGVMREMSEKHETKSKFGGVMNELREKYGEDFSDSSNFKKFYKSIKKDISHFKDPTYALNHFKKFILSQIKKEFNDIGGLKFQLAMTIKFKRQSIDREQTVDFTFNSRHTVVLSQNTVERDYDEIAKKMLASTDTVNLKQSGWTIDGCVTLYIHFATYQPFRGSSYIKLPPKLANKKAIVNVQNTDERCLVYSLLSCLHHEDIKENHKRVTKYERYLDELNTKNIDFPTPLSQIPKMERQNELAINVFGWDNISIVPYHVSKQPREMDRINLLLIDEEDKWHYCWIKDMSRLLSSQTEHDGKKFFCDHCLRICSSERVLLNHREDCLGINEAAVIPVMPEKPYNTLAFTHHDRSQMVPCVIYADFESIVKPFHKNVGDRTQFTAMHEACGYGYQVVWRHKTESPVIYRGEDAVLKFLRALQREEAKINDVFSTPQPIRWEDSDRIDFKSAAECWICKNKFGDRPSKEIYDLWKRKKILLNRLEKTEKINTLKKRIKEDRDKKEELIDDYILQLDEENGGDLDGITELENGIRWDESQLEEVLKLNKTLADVEARIKMEKPGFNNDKVADHCHLTGKYRGAAHRRCNLKLRCEKDKTPIPVVFHNLKGYDSHHILKEIGKISGRVTCIPQNGENFISFTLNQLRFIDSFQFMNRSLDYLVKINDRFPITDRIFGEKSERIKKKGIYPYEYMDSFEKFNETALPPKEQFYSRLSNTHVKQEDYDRAQSVWNEFGCRTLGDYHDLYLKSDVVLLADVFENFRSVAAKHYDLDPCHYYTSPGLAFDALLKLTGIELELLTDYDMHLFVEKGIRGGISFVPGRYSKANHPYSKEYDPRRPNKYIMYLDANALYSTAMSKHLPYRHFRWVEHASDPLNPPENKGYILEVDLVYPKELHDAHNDYPLAPEKLKVDARWLSDYQKELLESKTGLIDTGPPKLVPNLLDKHKYVVYHETLKLYLSLGLKLKKVHRILEFEEKPWMEPYIRFNTELRRASKNDFEKDFFKLMNNSVYGKTMENVRNRLDIKIVTGSDKDDRVRRINANPTFDRAEIINEDLVLVHVKRTRVHLNKPVYAGMVILDLSKHHMYRWYYSFLKEKYDDKCRLLYTDTDSLLIEVETQDAYGDMTEHESEFDFSDYPDDHPCFPPHFNKNKNKKVEGKFKDECCGIPIVKYVGLRPKMYSVLMDDSKVIKRAKGVKKCVVDQHIDFNHYKDALFADRTLTVGIDKLGSLKQQLYNVSMTKSALSPLDTKTHVRDDDRSKTYSIGHYKTVSSPPTTTGSTF